MPPQSHFEAEKFFDHIADDYKSRSEGQVYNTSSLSFRCRQDIVTQLLSATPKGGTVLDYGMGPAVFGPPAHEFGLRYIGIDISPRMVELAQAMNLPAAEYHVGDLDSLGKFAGVADTVLLIGLIDYLEEPVEGLRQLAACVKPGGSLILSFRNHRSFPRWFRNTSKELVRTLRPPRQDETTAFAAPVLENSFDPHGQLIPWLRDAGFTEFDLRYLDCSPVFFKVPLPPFLWNAWRKFDAAVAGPATSGMCASGALAARVKR